MNRFTYEVFTGDDIGLTILLCNDAETNYNVWVPLPGHDLAATKRAYAGSKYSRSADSVLDILKEIQRRGRAGERFKNIYKDYGHASVADMADGIMVYVEGIPDVYATQVFAHSAVGAGQHRSTRYQDFSHIKPQSLEIVSNLQLSKLKNYETINKAFESLQASLLQNYRRWIEELNPIYAKQFEVDMADAKQVRSMQSRVLDSARAFLPWGSCLRSAFCYSSTAREWGRLISQLKARKDDNLRRLGEQIEALLAPPDEIVESLGFKSEVSDLIRYTSADETTSFNLKELSKLIPTKDFVLNRVPRFNPDQTHLFDGPTGFKVLMQYILSIEPSATYKKVFDWSLTLDANLLLEISQAIFSGHNQFKQLGNQAQTNDFTFILQGGFSEVRDLIRQRAWGRFVPLLEAESNYSLAINDGFSLPAYLTDIPNLEQQRDLMISELTEYYGNLNRFIDQTKQVDWFPECMLLQVLPFAHSTQFWMHGSSKELSYMSNLRVGPGGHINYRKMAWDMADKVSVSDPFLSAMNLGQDRKPDASSRAEFLGRS